MLAGSVGLFVTRCVADRGDRVDRGTSERTAYAVQRLALDTLFNGREHATRLVLWASDAGDGPALEALGAPLARPKVPRSIDVSRLVPSLPARVVSEADLTTLFRRHPDAWAAFFREHPGAPGLVELSPVRLSPDGRVAETYVGRSCGEHCRNVWRVRVSRAADGNWRVDTLEWVRVPGA